MANHTTQGTGVLRLTAVTPVIEALFGGYSLDENYPGDGQANINKSTDDGYPTWGDVGSNLQILAETFGLIERDLQEPVTIKDLILYLAGHYGKDYSGAPHLIDPEWDDDAHLDDLFEIAQLLDDGHGLLSVEMTSGFYCSRPLLGEFGGHGLFLAKGVVARSGSYTAVLVGSKLNEAIIAGDVDASVAILRQHLAETMGWISDPEVKAEVAKRLGLPG